MIDINQKKNFLLNERVILWEHIYAQAKTQIYALRIVGRTIHQNILNVVEQSLK